jgi:phage gp29-like protein
MSKAKFTTKITKGTKMAVRQRGPNTTRKVVGEANKVPRSTPAATGSNRGKRPVVRTKGLEDRITSGMTTEWYPFIGEWEPQLVRARLYSAMQGSFSDAFDLFSTARDRTPRLFVNLHEMQEGASNVEVQIVPFAKLDEKPTDEAKERAGFIDWAFQQFRPEMGTDETGLKGLRYDMLSSLTQPSVNEFMYTRVDGKWVPRAAAWVHARKLAYDENRRLGIVPLNSTATDTSPSYSTHVMPLTPNKFSLSIYKTRSGSAAMSGLMRPIMPVWAMAEFGKKWMFDFMQKFGNGIPMIPIQPGTPEADVNAMEDWAANFASNAYLLWYQYGAEKPEIWESKRDAKDVPMAWVLDWANQIYDIVILGEIRMSEIGRTTQRGSSEQANALKKVKNERMRNVAASNAVELKESLVRALLVLNYGNDDECPDVQIDISEAQDPATLATTMKTWREGGYKLEIDDLQKVAKLPLVEVELTVEAPDPGDTDPAEGDRAAVEAALPEELKGKFRQLVGRKNGTGVTTKSTKDAKAAQQRGPTNGSGANGRDEARPSEKKNGNGHNGGDGVEAVAAELMRRRGGFVVFAERAAETTGAHHEDAKNAKDDAEHEHIIDEAVGQFAGIEAEKLMPILERANAIAGIEDEGERKKAVEKFEAELPGMLGELMDDQGKGEEMAGAIRAAMLEGMRETAEEAGFTTKSTKHTKGKTE